MLVWWQNRLHLPDREFGPGDLQEFGRLSERLGTRWRGICRTVEEHLKKAAVVPQNLTVGNLSIARQPDLAQNCLLRQFILGLSIIEISGVA